MAPVLEVSGGGAFLIRSLNPDDLFTPRGPDRRAAAVRPDRRRVHAQRGASQRSQPLRARLGEDARTAEESRRSRPAPPRDSGGLRRPGSRQGQRRLRRRAPRHQSVLRRIARHAHVDWHAADCLFRHARAEGEVSAQARQRGVDRRLRAHRAAVGLRRVVGQDHGAAHAGRHALPPERSEGVDHQRRLRRPLHRSSPRSTARSSPPSSSNAAWA